MLILEAGHLLLVGQRVIVEMYDNDSLGVPHVCICLHIDVPEHLVASPAANTIYDVAVYS